MLPEQIDLPLEQIDLLTVASNSNAEHLHRRRKRTVRCS